MRFMGILAVAVGCQALKIKDLGDLDLPKLRDEHDESRTEQILAQAETVSKKSQQDMELIQ